MESFVGVLDQAPAAMHAQAQPSRRPRCRSRQAAEVLEAQAAVMERAISTIGLPTDLLKSIGGLAGSEASEDEPSENNPTRRR